MRISPTHDGSRPLRLRVAEDFPAIRARMEELRREREHAMFANDERSAGPTVRRLLARERTLALERELQLRLRASWRR